MNMYDCFIDTLKHETLFLSVYGHINVYDLDGNFKEKLVLPGRPNYYSVIPLTYYSSIEDVNGKNNTILYDIGSNELPYTLMNQSQNKDYCYVPLRRKIGTRPPITHVFYHKKEEKGYAFDYLAEGCKMHHPLYFGDEYLITDIVYDDRETFRTILPDSEYKKLEMMLEDDNPCLLKLYFKK